VPHYVLLNTPYILQEPYDCALIFLLLLLVVVVVVVVIISNRKWGFYQVAVAPQQETDKYTYHMYIRYT
jgi:Mn2+/Fe2+ NRAMP family transporter